MMRSPGVFFPDGQMQSREEVSRAEESITPTEEEKKERGWWGGGTRGMKWDGRIAAPHKIDFFFSSKSSLGRLGKVSHQTETTIFCFLGARQLHYSEIIVISSRFCTAHKLLYPLLCKLRPGNWGKCFHRIQYIMRIKVSSGRAETGSRLQRRKETSPEVTHSHEPAVSVLKALPRMWWGLQFRKLASKHEKRDICGLWKATCLSEGCQRLLWLFLFLFWG